MFIIVLLEGIPPGNSSGDSSRNFFAGFLQKIYLRIPSLFLLRTSSAISCVNLLGYFLHDLYLWTPPGISNSKTFISIPPGFPLEDASRNFCKRFLLKFHLKNASGISSKDVYRNCNGGMPSGDYFMNFCSGFSQKIHHKRNS